MSNKIYNIDEEKQMEELLRDFFDDENNKEPFNCEATFQFNLAMFIKEHCKNFKKIVFEENVYENDKARCDLVVYLTDNHKVFIELKYVINGKCNEKEIKTTSSGARKSFISDFRRLRALEGTKYCIFVSNKDAVLKTGQGSDYKCQDFFNEHFKFNDIQKAKENKKDEKHEKYEHCHIIPVIWDFPKNKKNEKKAKCLLVNVDKTKIDIDFECQEDCSEHFEYIGRDGKKKKCKYRINTKEE